LDLRINWLILFSSAAFSMCKGERGVLFKPAACELGKSVLMAKETANELCELPLQLISAKPLQSYASQCFYINSDPTTLQNVPSSQKQFRLTLKIFPDLMIIPVSFTSLFWFCG